MTGPLILIIAVPLVAGAACSLLAGYITANREAEIADAEETLRLIAHRGGVTEPVPFASHMSRVNAPAMVEVHPRTQAPAHTPPHFNAPLPRAASVENPVAQAVSSPSATLPQLPELPIDFADEPNEEEETIVVSRWETGESMTKTIKAVWNISAGGSTAYKNARSRYRDYLGALIS